jgi:hypothetical protein
MNQPRRLLERYLSDLYRTRHFGYVFLGDVIKVDISCTEFAYLNLASVS